MSSSAKRSPWQPRHSPHPGAYQHSTANRQYVEEILSGLSGKHPNIEKRTENTMCSRVF